MERRDPNWPGDQTHAPREWKYHIAATEYIGNCIQDLTEQVSRVADCLEDKSPKNKGQVLLIDLAALWDHCKTREQFLDEVAKLLNSHRSTLSVFEDTTHPDYKGNLRKAFSVVERVRVHEHQRYRDGGTIEYRDRHNRPYFIPAVHYNLEGIFPDTRFSSMAYMPDRLADMRYIHIELEIVPKDEPL